LGPFPSGEFQAFRSKFNQIFSEFSNEKTPKNNSLGKGGTSMKGISEYLNVHSNALAVRSRRNNILASNIANAATPNFKARDIDFQSEIRKVESEGAVRATNPLHIKASLQGPTGTMLYRDPVSPSRDGNTVEMNVEQMEFSENVIRYQTSLTFLNNKISGLLSAIKGE
jgi:flagellar basal-body rod protein FlgB